MRFDRGELDEVVSDWEELSFSNSASNGFGRYESGDAGVSSPVGTVGVSLEVHLGTDADFDVLDDILFYESVRPCFEQCED